MITISLDLSDDLKRVLEARLQDGAYATIEEYVRELIQSDLADDEEAWEVTPELAAALAAGTASGGNRRSIAQMIVDCHQRRAAPRHLF